MYVFGRLNLFGLRYLIDIKWWICQRYSSHVCRKSHRNTSW